MIYPASLKRGYNIGVTATSSGIEDEIDIKRLDSAIRHFERLGYPVITTPNVRSKDKKGRSSDGITRAKELMDLIKDPTVSVIFTASGGDFLVEMLPFLDYKAIMENPKWIQGFSDTTGLTFTLTTNLDIATLYSYNFSTVAMFLENSPASNTKYSTTGNAFLQISVTSFKYSFATLVSVTMHIFRSLAVPSCSNASKNPSKEWFKIAEPFKSNGEAFVVKGEQSFHININGEIKNCS